MDNNMLDQLRESVEEVQTRQPLPQRPALTISLMNSATSAPARLPEANSVSAGSTRSRQRRARAKRLSFGGQLHPGSPTTPRGSASSPQSIRSPFLSFPPSLSSATSSIKTSSRAAEHTEEEWKAIHQQFLDMYITRDMPLPKVQAELKKIGFFATIRQYKRKIIFWHAQKYIKDEDRRFMLAKQYQRKVEGKKTAFTYHGRLVDYTKLKRGSKEKRRAESRSAICQTPDYITCFTPPEFPSAIPSAQRTTQYVEDSETLLELPATNALNETFAAADEHISDRVRDVIDVVGFEFEMEGYSLPRAPSYPLDIPESMQSPTTEFDAEEGMADVGCFNEGYLLPRAASYPLDIPESIQNPTTEFDAEEGMANFGIHLGDFGEYDFELDRQYFSETQD